MAEKDPTEIDKFILDEIESVPHLEALLLLWNSRPKQWPMDEVAQALYISPEKTRPILRDLEMRGMILCEAQSCWFNEDYAHSELIERLDQTYRREIVRISNMIHSKASPSVRAFARAFKFTKD